MTKELYIFLINGLWLMIPLFVLLCCCINFYSFSKYVNNKNGSPSEILVESQTELELESESESETETEFELPKYKQIDNPPPYITIITNVVNV